MGDGAKILVMVGAAPCAAADIEEFNRLFGAENLAVDFMAIGRDAADKYRGDYHHVVTYEPEDLPAFMLKRVELGGNIDYETHAHRPVQQYVRHVYPELTPACPHATGGSGSSALLGIKVGFKLGYRRIIMCGCPLDGERYVKFQRGILLIRDLVADEVRSMSGWTREIFGAPSREWFYA